jgi:hypothetical protein
MAEARRKEGGGKKEVVFEGILVLGEGGNAL